MSKLGLVINVPPAAGILYQNEITKGIRKATGDEFKTPDIIMRGLDWSYVKSQLNLGGPGYNRLAKEYNKIFKDFEKDGAKYIAIASNAFHVIVSYGLMDGVGIELLRPADPVIKEIKKFKSVKTVGILGHKNIMDISGVAGYDVYTRPLLENGYDVKIPTLKECDFVHDMVTSKEAQEQIPDISMADRWNLYTVMSNLKKAGANAILYACPNLPKIIKLCDTGEQGKFALRPTDHNVTLSGFGDNIRVFPASELHVDMIVKKILEPCGHGEKC